MALTNADLLARFEVEHFDRHSISAGRRKATLTVLNDLASRLDGRTLAEVTPSDLMAWQGGQLARGLSPNTVRNRETMIRAFMSWAYVAGINGFELSLQLKAVTSVRGATARLKPRPYKRHEIERFRELLDAKYPLAPKRGAGSLAIRRYLRGDSPFRRHVWRHARRLQYEAQVSLALEEGLRLTEIYHMTIPRLQVGGEAVVVRTAKSKPGQERVREVPYTGHSRLAVMEWLEFRAVMPVDHDAPWLTLRQDNPTGPQGFRPFSESLERFGEPGDFTWHRFRHTFATERLRAGLPLEKLQIMLGHSSLQQTLAYAEIVNSDVRAEADRTEDAFARALGLVAA